MKCFVCFLHITKRSNHLGCMGCIIFTNISDCTSPVRSDIIHNTTDNFTLLIGYLTLGLPQPQVEILFGCGDYTVQSLDLAESKAYQLYDIGLSIALFFSSRMLYLVWRKNGIRVPNLFRAKMVVCHFKFILQIFQH